MRHLTDMDEEALRLTNELWAILDEHLPEGMTKTTKDKVEALRGNAYAQADYHDKKLYRALMGLIPEYSGAVNAAFLGVLFDGSMDEAELHRWASGIEWALTPRETRRISDQA